MFASNNAEVLNLEKKTPSKEPLKGLLHIHQKLKQIARIESQVKINNKLDIAPLNQEDIKKLKEIESLYGCVLVAYKSQDNLLSKKNKILNQIEILLTDYLKLLESNQKENDSFSKFFE